VPSPDALPDGDARDLARRALRYMDLAPGTSLRDVPVDAAFIGSCTNGRLEDLRAAAAVLRGRRVAPNVLAIVVPGSMSVRAEAQREGLDEVFRRAGFEWRGSGCSMCVAGNGDILPPGARAASSTNRNFEGRQGTGALPISCRRPAWRPVRWPVCSPSRATCDGPRRYRWSSR